jgi:hypothetical protein
MSLRLNGLDRFRKSRSGLTLEVHSHCEVPAGCGGAVLRWRRPGTPIGLSIFQHVNGEVDGFFLDGERSGEQRTTVQPGTHVLSFTVDGPAEGGLVLLEMSLEPALATAKSPRFTSGTHGTWRASTSEPPEGWRAVGFDDSVFVPLVEREVPAPEGNRKWAWEHLSERARGLGLPEKAGWRKWLGGSAARVWVRCTFRVDDEGFA